MLLSSSRTDLNPRSPSVYGRTRPAEGWIRTSGTQALIAVCEVMIVHDVCELLPTVAGVRADSRARRPGLRLPLSKS